MILFDFNVKYQRKTGLNAIKLNFIKNLVSIQFLALTRYYRLKIT